jgi:hypothetical protein
VGRPRPATAHRWEGQPEPRGEDDPGPGDGDDQLPVGDEGVPGPVGGEGHYGPTGIEVTLDPYLFDPTDPGPIPYRSLFDPSAAESTLDLSQLQQDITDPSGIEVLGSVADHGFADPSLTAPFQQDLSVTDFGLNDYLVM